MQQSLIRPGLLVSLKTSLAGGVTYEQTVLDPDHPEGAARVAQWQTRRTIVNAAEHAAATVARSRTRTLIRAACIDTAFGLLCPADNEEKLAEAIAEAQVVANAHNATARCTRVEFWVLTGRVADTDEAASRAIGAEVRSMLDAMEEAVRAADPSAIREAATRAKRMAGMLTDKAGEAVKDAVDEVRAVARDIVRRVEKSGEQAADVVEGITLDALQSARFAVLDLTGGEQVEVAVAGRALDLQPEEDACPA